MAETIVRMTHGPCLLPSGNQQIPLNLSVVFSEKPAQPRVLGRGGGTETVKRLTKEMKLEEGH